MRVLSQFEKCTDFGGRGFSPDVSYHPAWGFNP